MVLECVKRSFESLSSRGGSGYTLIYAAKLVSLLSWSYDYVEGLHIFFEQLAVPVI